MEDKRIVILIEKAQELGWDITERDAEYEFQQYSPAGEDFQFYVDKEFNETADSFIEKIRDVYIDFDPEEHVKMWMDAKNNGIKNIPSLYALVHDADDIEKMLDNLIKALEAVQYVWIIGFSDPNTGEKLVTEVNADSQLLGY